MNVYEQNSTKASVLAFCSPNAEIAADSIDTANLAETLRRVTNILRHSVGMHQYSMTVIEDHEMISWTSESQGNFIWLATFAQYLHLNHFSQLGYFEDCFDDLNQITNAFDKLPIGDFTTIPNLAESKKYGIDYRHLNNPYDAYSLLIKDLASRAG